MSLKTEVDIVERLRLGSPNHPDHLLFLEAADEIERLKKVVISTTRFTWLIERSSMWGIEWFCAGEERWTKDANKAIQFPDKSSASEIFFALRNTAEREFPFSEEGAGDWDYTYNIAEHGFIQSY